MCILLDWGYWGENPEAYAGVEMASFFVYITEHIAYYDDKIVIKVLVVSQH